MEKDHVGVLGHHLVEHGPDALVIVAIDAAGEGDPGALRQEDLSVRTAARIDELAASIIAAVIVARFTIEPVRGRQAWPV
jgi:hypothetical protein